jgi:prepilin peptidase CpaA
MDHSLAVPVVVVLAGSLVAAITDVWKFKVHNLLTIPLFASGLFYRAVVGGWPQFLDGLYGGLFGFGILLMLYLLGGMGAGDVKFMAAVGAWLGFSFTIIVFLAASLAAGIYAVVLLVAFGNLRETWANLQIIWHRITALGRVLGAEDRVETEIQREDRRRRLIPFTAMVAVGILATLFAVWIASQ